MIRSSGYIILREKTCQHCSFSIHLPDVGDDHAVLCPRCWRPIAEADPLHQSTSPLVEFSTYPRKADERTPATTRSTAPAATDSSTAELTADPSRMNRLESITPVIAESTVESCRGAEHVPDDCSERDSSDEISVAVPQPICLHTEVEHELSFREKFRRWFSSCGISLGVHAALLALAALIVFQSYQFEWDSTIDSSISESDALFAFEQMEEIAAPTFELPVEITPIALVESVADHDLRESETRSVAMSNTAEGQGNVGFFGTHADGNSFSFIVDISGSMSSPFYQSAPPDQQGQPPRMLTRWDKAREELLQAVDSMTAEQSFSVTLYNTSDVTFRGGRPKRGMYPASKSNKRALRRWLNQYSAGGGTDPRHAIAESLAKKPEVVFLLTDGIIPYESRTVAQTANQHEAVIHTTCIGAIENEILQLIAQDHQGRFRGVVDAAVVSNVAHPGATGPRSREITLVCVVSDSTTHITKFRHVQKKYQGIREALVNGDLAMGRNSGTVLVLHNTASEISEFNHQLQRLLRGVNSGVKTGFQQELHSGRIGMGLSLDRERPKDYRQALDDAYERTSTICDLLETVVPKTELQQAVVSIPQVIVFGERDARQEVLSAVEVYNLYNGSTMRVIDGDEVLRK